MRFLFLLVISFSFIVTRAQIPDASLIGVNQVIVKFKNDDSNNLRKRNSVFADVNQRNGALKVYKVNTGKDSKDVIYTIKYADGADIKAIMHDLDATGLFEYTEPDYIGHATGVRSDSITISQSKFHQPPSNLPQSPDLTPNDFYFGNQWALYNNGSFTCVSGCSPNAPPPARNGADIKMREGWDITTGNSSVIVGFIDSGCRFDQPEFSGRIWVNPGEIPNNGIDDDGNGYTDDVNGWDFQNNDNDPGDDFGHGTNTAAVVGANGNDNIGVAGVDWNCKLMITKGLDNGGNGLYSTWVSCIHYLVDNGATIINMSLAGKSPSATMQAAIDYAYKHGVLVIASMGNDNVGTRYYPAGCNHVMAIGATNLDDSRCDPFVWGGGSNYGDWMSVCAPGNLIYSPDHTNSLKYPWWSGTSESAPYTSGLAALLKGQKSSRTPDEIQAIIENTADDLGAAGPDMYFGNGRINTYRALSALPGITASSDCGSFMVSPNPASKDRSVLVSLNGTISSEIVIHDVTGKLLWDNVIGGDVFNTVDYSFTAGVYFVSCINSSQYVTKKLLIY